MSKKTKKSERYIELKEGNNWAFIIGSVTLFALLFLIGTSKSWLPDDRVKLSTQRDTPVYFTSNMITITDYSIDYENGLGEIRFSEEITNNDEKYALTYKVVDENENELPILLSQSALKNDDDSIHMLRNNILQFGIPGEFYYVKLMVGQADNKTQGIPLDYRDFEEKSLTEKGKDYLVNLEQEQAIYETLKSEIQPIEDQYNALTTELWDISRLADDKQDTARKEELIKQINEMIETLAPMRKKCYEQYIKIQEFDK